MNRLPLFLLILYAVSAVALSPMDRIRISSEYNSRVRSKQSLPILYRQGGEVKTGQYNLEEVLALEKAGYSVSLSRPLELCMDLARIHANANDIVYQKDTTLPVTGKGVIVGVVDVGFDFTHPAFFNKDGKSRIVAVWDQGVEDGTPPKNFTYGQEWDTEAEILKAQHGSQDYHSHGSHVAGIIGGRAVNGLPYAGVAPECEFIFVATPMEESQVIDAVRYVFQKAAELGKPAVVNLSLGSSSGPHDGTTLTDLAYEQLDTAKKVIVTAGGNSGAHRMHIRKSISATDSLQTLVDVPWHLKGMDFWGEEKKSFTIGFTLHDKDGAFMQKIGAISSVQDSLDTITVLNSTDTLQITAFATDSSELNGRPNIAVLITDVTKNLNGKHLVGLTITGTGTIHGWNSSYAHFKSLDKEGYSDGTTDYTIIDGGGCSRGALTVGAMTSKNSYVNMYDTVKAKTEEIVGDIAPFSAIGPTIDGRQKPEIVTPGNQIIAPFNSFNDWKDSTEITDTFTVDGRTYAYGKMSGTSMATPFAAGAVALMLEVNPNLTRTDILKILKESAKEDEFTGTFTEGVYSRWGYGKFDVKAAVNAAEIHTPVLHEGGNKIGNITTFVTPHKIRLHLRNIDAKVEKIEIFTVQGKRLAMCRLKVNSEEILIPLQNIGQSILLYKITTETGQVQGKIRF